MRRAQVVVEPRGRVRPGAQQARQDVLDMIRLLGLLAARVWTVICDVLSQCENAASLTSVSTTRKTPLASIAFTVATSSSSTVTTLPPVFDPR